MPNHLAKAVPIKSEQFMVDDFVWMYVDKDTKISNCAPVIGARLNFILHILNGLSLMWQLTSAHLLAITMTNSDATRYFVFTKLNVHIAPDVTHAIH